MLKIIFGIVAAFVLLLIVFLMMCAMIVAGCYDEENSRQNAKETDEDMFFKKQICPKCNTGKESYKLDRHSDACPYIGCWKDGKCQFYVPLEKSPKKDILTVSKISKSPPRKNRALHSILNVGRLKRFNRPMSYIVQF